MLHSITVLSFSTPVTSASSGAARNVPWSNIGAKPVSFDKASIGWITISDDDPGFNSGIYSPLENDQRLQSDVTLGIGPQATIIRAGTQLGNYLGSIMRAPNGDQFVMVFPRNSVPGTLGAELANRNAVLVMPLPVMVAGKRAFPTFDPKLPHTYMGISPVSVGSDELLYAPCFAQGTLIRTADGLRAVEDLRVSDLVATLDHGLQPVLWLGSRLADLAHLDLRPQDGPVTVSAGALGPG